MLSEAARAFIGKCYDNGNPRVIQPIIGFKYEVDGKSYIFTEELLEEIKNSGQVRVMNRFGKFVNIVGI
jgi:hypothetical protein